MSGSVSRPSGSKRAPIFMSGAVMRRMGRRCSESSPVSSTRTFHGASTPMSRRTVVPELPQSMGASGCEGPAAPHPVTPPAKLPSGCFSSDTCAPSWPTALMDERTSSESSTPESREVPSAMAANSTARCEMDLSPGTEAEPRRGAGSGLTTVAFASCDMGMLLCRQGTERY